MLGDVRLLAQLWQFRQGLAYEVGGGARDFFIFPHQVVKDSSKGIRVFLSGGLRMCWNTMVN